MRKEEFSDILGDIDERFVKDVHRNRAKAKKPVWVKWGAMASCLCFVVCAALVHYNNGSTTTTTIADAAPMVYVNDTLYKQSTSQTSFNELKDDFVYLGVIESEVTNFQGTNEEGSYSVGIPKENFQANIPIVGAEVYRYGDDIVVLINGQYWLYEKYEKVEVNWDDLSEEEKAEKGSEAYSFPEPTTLITGTFYSQGQETTFEIGSENYDSNDLSTTTVVKWFYELELNSCDAPEEVEGGESYVFYVKGENAFTYEDRGSEAYIIIGGNYYKVGNPSTPPIN